MVQVFLSHSTKDKPFVRDLADALEAGGEIKVWLDEREIDYGQNIVRRIQEGLDADFALLIFSPDSIDSKWVKEEWTDAYWEQVESQHVKLAGVLYRDCRIPRLLRNKEPFDLRTNHPRASARSRRGSWASVHLYPRLCICPSVPRSSSGANSRSRSCGIACRNPARWPTFPAWQVEAKPLWRWRTHTATRAISKRCTGFPAQAVP